MKVGTDGVLIGAWAALPENGTTSNLLDIGSGCGLISIMAAQRADSISIDGIDIEQNSITQAIENASLTPWKDRIKFTNVSLQDFTPNIKYDYIVSNPPYFINSLKDGQGARVVARHTNTLSYDELANGVNRLLTEKGIFSVILPYLESNIFIIEAAKHSLYCNKRLDIKGKSTTPIKRVMLQFSHKKTELTSDELTIEGEERHVYTTKYKELTKNFYLKF